MAQVEDYRRPLLDKQDRHSQDFAKCLPNGKPSNRKAEEVLDIALREDSETSLDDGRKGSQHDDALSFDDDHEEEDQVEIREISASVESYERRFNDELHGLYSFLGDQPALEPMPTVDPFRNHTEDIGTLYEWIKVVLCLPLAIIRLLLSILITVVGTLLAKILLLGWREKHLPMPKWRRTILYITRLLGRLILFCFGYHWIRRLGKRSKREVAPIVISNHLSFIDPIFFFYELFPSFVSSASHSNLPGIGMIIRPMQVISVDRSSADSKKHALNEIKSKAMCNSFPHVMLFPEGTTTNGKALIFFQLGAFMPGLPVQPVVLRYPFVHFDNSWGRISILKLVFRMLTQFHNFMEVEYLPVVYPSPREKGHPTLFAKKVKNIMAKALNVAETNHSYGDLVLCTRASELKHTSSASYLVEMSKMEKLFHVNTKEAMDFLEKFQAMDSNHRGCVSEDQFLQSLELPKTAFSQQIFGFFDKEEEGSISFREFLAGSAFILKHPSFESLCRAAFESCDFHKQGFLSSLEIPTFQQRNRRFLLDLWTPRRILHPSNECLFLKVVEMIQVTRVGCLVRSLNSYVNYPHVYTTSPQMYVTARGVGSRILFVGGISNRVKEEDLRTAFASHGEIIEARLSVDPRSKISRGFGFIKYASVKEAEDAMKLMNGQVLSGKRIRVAYAVSEPKVDEK